MLANQIQKLFKRNFSATWAKKYRQFTQSHQTDRDTLIIYQMGKVGSSSIKRSINDLALDMNIYHVHALTDDRIKELEKVYRKASKVYGNAVIHNHLVESAFLRNLLDKGEINRRLKLITLVRDPVARNFSSFFQSFKQFFPEMALKYEDGSLKMEDDIETLIQLFIEKFDHEMPLRWFDSYLKPVFEIDVYASKFPTTKGYDIYSGGMADLLLLRLEDLDRCAPVAFNDFLGIDNFVLKSANIAEEKYYQRAYRAFRKSIILPQSYIDKMYTSKFAKHFYTLNEIEQFKRKWQKGVSHHTI